MADSSAVLQKKSEVRDMAQKYGVEQYLGTQKLEMADAYIQMWAKDSQNMDSLEANSAWLDTKADIEDMMANLSLTQNTKADLYLLGASATGQVNFAEVQQAYVQGWNTLLEQYGEAIASIDQVAMTDLSRTRDRFLAQLPQFGTPQEKVEFSKMAATELRNVEATLQKMLSDSRINEGKMELAKRETTRTMILAEAKSGLSQGRIPVQVNQEIQNLVGRGNSLFAGQVKSMKLFKDDPSALFQEMDRVLQKANLLLRTQENQFSLAGVSKAHDPAYHQYSRTTGATGMIGDGLRVVKAQNMIFNTIPKNAGRDVVNYSNPPQIFQTNQAPPEATVFPTNLFQNKKPTFANPSSVYRDESMMSRFEQFRANKALFGAKSQNNPAFQHKNAGLQGTSPLGETAALDSVSSSRLVQVVMVGGFFYMLTKVGSVLVEKPLKGVVQGSARDPSNLDGYGRFQYFE